MIDIDTLFKNSYVLYSDERSLSAFNSRFLSQNLPLPHPILTMGVNCHAVREGRIVSHAELVETAGHYQAIVLAKFLDLPYMMVFECNASPVDGCMGLLDNVISNIPEDTDLVKLCGIRSDCSKNAVLSRTNNIFCVQSRYGSKSAYIIFKKYYDTFLRLMNGNALLEDTVINYRGNTTNNSMLYNTSNTIFECE